MSIRRGYGTSPSTGRGSDWLPSRYDKLLELQTYADTSRHVTGLAAASRKSSSCGDDVRDGAGLGDRYGRLKDGLEAERNAGTVRNGYSYHGYGEDRTTQAALRSRSNLTGHGSGSRYQYDNNDSSRVALSLDHGHRLANRKTNAQQQLEQRQQQQRQQLQQQLQQLQRQQLRQQRQQLSARKSEPTATEAYYAEKLKEIIYDRRIPAPKATPARITDYLYLGSYWNAKNAVQLRRLGVTHVLNCAATPGADRRNPYNPETGVVGYMSVAALDVESYDMLQHVERANSFIGEARRAGGRVLVHCMMGINRSGFLVAAYLVGVLKIPLLTAVRLLKEKRGTVLYNAGFQKQLIAYARKKGLL